MKVSRMNIVGCTQHSYFSRSTASWFRRRLVVSDILLISIDLITYVQVLLPMTATLFIKKVSYYTFASTIDYFYCINASE